MRNETHLLLTVHSVIWNMSEYQELIYFNKSTTLKNSHSNSTGVLFFLETKVRLQNYVYMNDIV